MNKLDFNQLGLNKGARRLVFLVFLCYNNRSSSKVKKMVAKSPGTGVMPLGYKRFYS